MTETEILKPKTSQKLIIYEDSDNNIKLPKIQNPKSRGNLQSKAQKRKNTPPLLPNIKQNILTINTNNEEKPQTKQIDPSTDPQKDDFALQIEEKLRMILENVNQGEQIEQYDNDDQQIDFQEAIQQNKQKLKHQKQLKAQSNNNIIEKPVKVDKKQTKTKSRTLKNKYENNIYEKRMKQYRDISNENKFIQKKKELILQKQENIDKMIRVSNKGKQDGNIGNYYSGAKIAQGQNNKDKEKGPLRPKFSAKSLKEEDIQRLHYQNAKSANLFDNIHNFLQNPQKNRIPNDIRKFSRTNIKNLEQQIKQINQKLGVGTMQNIQNELKTSIEQKTVLDWKRLQYNRGSNFKCHYDSNFEKQVDRIGSLQQKNSNYLTKLIDHQKTLVQLSLIKKSITLKQENEQQ